MAVRVLFVSSVTMGGSGRSQRELAARLLGLGHSVEILTHSPSSSRFADWWCKQWDDALVKLTHPSVAWLVRAIESRNGRSVRRQTIEGVEHHLSLVPENALLSVARSFRPDVVVGNSVRRVAWRRIRRLCKGVGIPTVLYVREDEVLRYFEQDAPPGDAFVANAQSLCDAIRDRGFECSFIPSVIEVEVTRVESTRRVALVINPVESRGASIVERVARAVPEIPFVVQESWPLSAAQMSWVATHLSTLPNVEFRASRPPGPGLYADAKVLLVPYRVDNRPRVIAEAQANGIPVVVGDVPALREAVGGGGLVVPLEDVAAWVGALRTMWHDPDEYAGLSARARKHSLRDEINPSKVAEQFVAVLDRVVHAAESSGQ